MRAQAFTTCQPRSACVIATAAPSQRRAPRVTSATGHVDPQRSDPSALASRRAALQGLLAGMVAVGAAAAAPPAALAGSADRREGEVRHSDAEWRELLPPDAYAVLRTAATEPRFSSPLVEEHRTGTFACGGCGAPLFPSSAKYESGTGWPSFADALPGAVDTTNDSSIPFMTRTEVRCHRCQGHLGHVFNDGPPPTFKRYCMNGAALTFRPAEA